MRDQSLICTAADSGSAFHLAFILAIRPLSASSLLYTANLVRLLDIICTPKDLRALRTLEKTLMRALCLAFVTLVPSLRYKWGNKKKLIYYRNTARTQ